ncbi:unnamed protein product [Oikopleura dioica]|uniref:Sushi domain-containing protein n=1 Tax=Oikopleura dioica TaxID=34765 RepID=E4Y4H1_OIKDI|nr:unnamed protein product [Oikopleura dioica]
MRILWVVITLINAIEIEADDTGQNKIANKIQKIVEKINEEDNYNFEKFVNETYETVPDSFETISASQELEEKFKAWKKQRNAEERKLREVGSFFEKNKNENEDVGCSVLPPNCNDRKFRFRGCTNEDRYNWKNGDKCRFISSQDERWRWRSVQCKCRKSGDERSCGLETAYKFYGFYFSNFSFVKNCTRGNNRTRQHGHLPGDWEAYRKENGRLDWVPMKIPNCGSIGRAVSQCPTDLDKNQPFYIDRDISENIKFGDIARIKCPNRIVNLDGSEEPRVWKIKCGIGAWTFMKNGSAIQEPGHGSFCQTEWGAWGEWSACSSSCDGGIASRKRNCFYKGECAITKRDSALCNETTLEILHPLSSQMCAGGEEASTDSILCAVGVKCIRWASWTDWSAPSDRCESRRFRECQNCLANGTCLEIPRNEQTCDGPKKEVEYHTNRVGCKYILSIQEDKPFDIFDIRRGKISALDGNLVGVPKSSPFKNVDCYVKLKGTIYVLAQRDGEYSRALYKSQNETESWERIGGIPENTTESSCVASPKKIWRCGGFINKSENIRSDKCFSWNGTEWIEEAKMNAPRAGHSILATSRTLYVFGGNDQSTSLEIFNSQSTSKSWKMYPWNINSGSPIWNPRKDYAWFIGSKQQKSDKIWRFDPQNNKMELFGHLSKPRIDPSAMLSMRELDRNASGRGKPQLMIDGGQRANKKTEIFRELCDIWNWKAENHHTNICDSLDRLGEVKTSTVVLPWP